MKLWFSIFDRTNYTGSEPYFWDTSKIAWTKLIESNYPVIKEELLNYLKTNQLESYFNQSMVATPNTWKTVSLKTWSIELYRHQISFPKTNALIKQVPGLVSASFNMLTPHSHIVPHNGDTNGIYRCHLGLIVPANAPDCGFKVGDETVSWEEGKLLIFTDAHRHEAWNNTPNNRFIFLFDVVRPEFIDRKDYICSMVMCSLWGQKRAEKYKNLYQISIKTQVIGVKILRIPCIIAIKTMNILGKHFKLFRY